MKELLIPVISILFGMWVNNVFTWKIKNKIVFIDSLIDALLEFEHISSDPPTTLEERNKELHKKLNTLERKVTSYVLILNNHDLKNKIENYLKIRGEFYVVKICCLDYEQENEIMKTSFHLKFSDLQEEILLYRQKLTSFCYMLRKINPFRNMCNK